MKQEEKSQWGIEKEIPPLYLKSIISVLQNYLDRDMGKRDNGGNGKRCITN